MPTYVYECKKCESTFEKLVEMQFRDRQKCIGCDEYGITRKFNATPSHFIGDGFYAKTNNDK